jgi:hypothetical protein
MKPLTADPTVATLLYASVNNEENQNVTLYYVRLGLVLSFVRTFHDISMIFCLEGLQYVRSKDWNMYVCCEEVDLSAQCRCVCRTG